MPTDPTPMRLVPVEASPEIIEALYGPYLSTTAHVTRRQGWRDAIAAAPPVGEEVVERLTDAMMAVEPRPYTRIVAKMYARAILSALQGSGT